MANNKKNTSKCVERLGNGKRCNKPVVQGTSHCKNHSSNLKSSEKKSTKNLKRGEVISIYLAVLFFLLGIIYNEFKGCSGPTLENQEEIINNQKLQAEKSDNQFSILISKLNSRDSISFEREKKVFEQKSQEVEVLKSQVKKLNKKVDQHDKAILDLKIQLDSVLTIRREESDKFTLRYKNINYENQNLLLETFKYGYATYLIGVENNISLIDKQIPYPEIVSLDWANIKCSVTQKEVILQTPKISFKSESMFYEGNTDQISRNFNDLGRLYFSMVESPKIETALSVIADTKDGILLVIGFLERGGNNNQNKNTNISFLN